MNHTRTAAIVGGDVRQVFLGELLAADGMRVGTVGLERHVCELPIFCDMAALFAEADVVLLTLDGSHETKCICMRRSPMRRIGSKMFWMRFRREHRCTAARFRKRCMNRHGAGRFDCMII